MRVRVFITGRGPFTWYRVSNVHGRCTIVIDGSILMPSGTPALLLDEIDAEWDRAVAGGALGGPRPSALFLIDGTIVTRARTCRELLASRVIEMVPTR